MPRAGFKLTSVDRNNTVVGLLKLPKVGFDYNLTNILTHNIYTTITRIEQIVLDWLIPKMCQDKLGLNPAYCINS